MRRDRGERVEQEEGAWHKRLYNASESLLMTEPVKRGIRLWQY